MLIISNKQYEEIESVIDQNMINSYKELLEHDYPGFLYDSVNFNWDKYLLRAINYLRSCGFEEIENYYYFMCLAVSHAEMRKLGISIWLDEFLKDYSKDEEMRLELLADYLTKIKAGS